MIQVYRIPVPKERLRAMPKDERVLLLLLGYVANQVSMLQKLLTFATNRTPAEELEQHASSGAIIFKTAAAPDFWTAR